MPSPDLHQSREASGQGDLGRPWIVSAICVFLVAITWLVFAQTLHHEFVNYDDNKYVYENAQVSGGLSARGVLWAFTHSHARLWHPLATISHMADCQFYGLKAGGHHFTNVFLHAIAAVLLFLALRALTGTLWRSAFVAVLFAIHPLRVESVAWVAERKDVLSGVFLMLTLLAYVRYTRKPSLARYVMMSISLTCGLLSKATFVTVPFVLLLLDYWPLRRMPDLRNLRRMLLEKIPLFALSAGSCIATAVAQTATITSLQNLPLSLRIENAVVTVITYIGQMVWPVRLAVFYPHPLHQLSGGIVALAVALVAGISLVAVLVARSRPYVPVGWFWYLGMLVPMIGLVQVGLQGHADRFTYLPHIGLYLLVTWGIVDLTARWPFRRQILGAAAAIVIAALAWRAHAQTQIWHDAGKLWTHTLAVTHHNDVAHAGLADVLLAQGRAADAIAHFEESLAIRPDNPEAHNKAGLALFNTGNPGAAIAHWKLALEFDPQNLNAESNMAWIFATSPEASMRDGARAVQLIQDVIQRSGTRDATLLRTLAAAYAECGRFSEAISAANEALDLANAQGNASLAADLRSSIDNYQANIPLRDPSLANAHPWP